MGTVALVLSSGLLGACAPKTDQPPPPNVTAQENCIKPVKEKAQADGTRKLTSDVLDTVNAIRDMCGTKVINFHVQRIDKVVQSFATPGVSVDGCVQPSERQVTSQDFLRPVCFQSVSAKDVQLNTNKKFENAGGFFLIQPSNGQSDFRPKTSFGPVEFIWRSKTNIGVKDFYYINRRGKFQALVMRTLPEAEADGRDPVGTVELWCVNGDAQLEYFGDLNEVAKRRDSTGRLFGLFFMDQLQPTLDRWSDYQAATS